MTTSPYRIRETLYGTCPTMVRCVTRLLATLTVVMCSATLTLGLSLNAVAQSGNGEQAVVQIVRLQHRDPAPIREAIAPHLDERGAISQIDNNLIISTTRANLAELQSLITELDVPRRQLRISVDFHYGRPTTPTPINSVASDSSVVTTISTQDPADYSVQSIVVSEGEFAHFSLVSSTPQTGLRFTELGAVLSQERERSGSSLTVSAEPRGQRAVLEIASEQRQPDSSQQVISSTLELDFNTWQVISNSAAGLPTTDDTTASTTVNTTQILTTTNTPNVIAVRVELLP
ncbi:MAG: secretin N-terminal domain-containing protein [Pseudomonadota bacterium]